jgi:hypothetical protein
MRAGHLDDEGALDLTLSLALERHAGVQAISQIPLFGSRAAAISCCSEAPTNALEAVPNALCRRCHHSGCILEPRFSPGLHPKP